MRLPKKMTMVKVITIPFYHTRRSGISSVQALNAFRRVSSSLHVHPVSCAMQGIGLYVEYTNNKRRRQRQRQRRRLVYSL